MKLVGVLLAAGFGRRFGNTDGSGKLDQILPDGRPLALASAQALKHSVEDCVAVVQRRDSKLADQLRRLGFALIEQPEPERGMGYSLARAVSARRDADAWMIALADMPWILPSTIALLRDALVSGAELVAPLHAGQRGHPVGFGNGFGDALVALDGDIGARDVIKQATDRLRLIEVDDPGVLRDVDYAQDLNHPDN